MPYTGSLALRLTAVEELLCRSARFRAQVGAGSERAAAAKVHGGELSDVLNLVAGGTLDVARPCAIIGAQRHGYVQIGQGSSLELLAVGAVWVMFLDNPKFPADYKLSLLDFADWTSRVMDEISLDVGRDTRWPFSAIRMFFEPLRPDLADRAADDYWLGGYVLDDTVNAG
jgi:hypothetical protein